MAQRQPPGRLPAPWPTCPSRGGLPPAALPLTIALAPPLDHRLGQSIPALGSPVNRMCLPAWSVAPPSVAAQPPRGPVWRSSPPSRLTVAPRDDVLRPIGYPSAAAASHRA